VSIAQQLERVPPQNLEAEQGVLGSMLLDRDAIARALEGLRADDFYRDAHRVIFQAMVELFERGEPVDLITVTNRLAATGKLEDVGGATYVAALPNLVPTAANVDFYANIVLEKSMLRALINAGTHIAAMGYDGADDVAAMIDHAEKLVFGIAQRRNVQDFEAIKEILKQSFEKIDRRYQEKGTITGVATGFSDFDMLTSGLQPADMVVVAARPSVGKCVSADTEIVLEDGSLATIAEIYRRRRARLLTLGSDRRLRFTEPSAFVDDGRKPVFRITTRLGRSVEATACHPFLTRDGWLPLAALRAGERIAVPGRLPVFGSAAMSDESVHRLADSMADERLWEIPVAAFTLRRPQLASFLNRLFAATGTASANAEGVLVYAGYAVKRERPARQVQHLLLRFGIVSSVGRSNDPLGGKPLSRTWQVEITDPASLCLFASEIVMFATATAEPIVVLAAARKRVPTVYPTRHAASAGTRALSRRRPGAPTATMTAEPPAALDADHDICWDEIVSIEALGLKQVYDLTIPLTHNFVANDVCCHNTTLALNVAQHAALVNKLPVAIFSLETSKEQLVQRILCSEAQVDNSKLRTGFLADEDWRKLARAMGGLSEAPIFIDDSATLSIIEMRAKARKLKAEHGLGLIVVDYIQMIQSYKRAENRTQELSEIARGIKSLAKELDVPIIAISQLSRAVEALGQKRPMLSHLRECVTGDTVVWDADTGRRHTVAELAAHTEWPRLLSLDRTGRLVPVRPAAVFEKGHNEVFEIRTTTGRRVCATANHPILTPDGWKPVEQLTEGSLVAAARSLPVFSPKPPTLTPERLRLLGYLIGDGSYQYRRTLTFISNDPHTFEDCITIAEREFGIVGRRGRMRGVPYVKLVSLYPHPNGNGQVCGKPGGNALRNWLRELGIEGQRYNNKRIPERVFHEADRNGLCNLLRALYSADGCITRRRYTRTGGTLWSLHYDTTSRELADDVRDLLLRFGIVSQISGGYKSKMATVPIYRVTVEDVRHLYAFCEQIGIEGRKGELVTRCRVELAHHPRIKPWIDRLPYSVTTRLWDLKKEAGLSWRRLGFRLQTGKTLDRPTALALADRLGAADIKDIATSDLLWDRIVCITPKGRAPVYDLMMPGTHNFIANGITVKNSGEIEQVSDLVVFLYREDYYDQEKAQKDNKENVCELIIAKHRNGPIGTVELYFHKEYSRFANLEKRRQ
jgi:replicative DNA helicase